ncbi:hypothetical protein EBU24_02265, partial [bacterium]|nr:hypothetical protein [bacterium]
PAGSHTNVVPKPAPSPVPTSSAITDITSQSSYISSSASVVALRPFILSYLSEVLESEISYELPENTQGLQLGYLPIRGENSLPLQTVFTHFYNQIVNGTALSYSINTHTGPTTQTAPAVSYSSLLNTVLPLFVTTDSGQYYGYAFTSGNVPLQILSDAQTEIVTYAQLAMDNITYLNYATTDGINFVGNGTFFATTPTAGTVAPQYQVTNSAGSISAAHQATTLPDSHIAQLNNFFDGQLFTTFNNSFSTNQSLLSESASIISVSGAQQNYTTIYNNYLYQISNNVARWGFALIAKLASLYNAQVYFNGANGLVNANAGFNGMPNIALLDNYGALTITAINQLNSVAQAMNITIIPPSTVQLYNNLGDIAGYAGFRSLELAASYVAGTATPPSTSPSTGIPSQNNQPSLDPQTTAQQLATALTLNNKTVGQVQPSVSPSVILQAVVESIINAYQYFSLAQSYYSQAQNNVMIGFYQEKVSSLQKLTDSIEQVSTDMSNVPILSATSSPDDLTHFMNIYNDIQNNFDLVAQAFYQMSQSGLGLYFQKLSAQAGIGQYQQVLTTLSAWYGGTSTSYGISNSGGYINYANAEPIVSVSDWSQNAANALEQETNFQTLITYLQQQVTQASIVYAQELSFYSALGSNLTDDDQKIMADLYATVQIFEHLSKGLAGMGYLQDILGKNYETATDFSGVIATIMASENMFIDALNELAQADALIAKASPGVLDYVQVQNIFANQNPSIYTPATSDGLPVITTFYNLAYVHRARLCYHAGQILAAQQEPMALYLLWASVALYNQLASLDPNGTTSPYSWANNNQSWINNTPGTIPSFIASNSTLFKTLFSRASTLSGLMSSLTIPTDISATYQQLMMIYFTLFSTDSNDTGVTAAVSKFIADVNAALTWYQTPAGQTVTYANLMQAMINYQAYLMYNVNGDTTNAGTYLTNAQNLLNTFKISNQIDPKVNATPITIPQVPTDQQFQQISAQLQAQADALLAVQQASIDQGVLEAYYLPGTVTSLDFSLASINFYEQLGDLYFNYATNLLTTAKNNFNAGSSYNSNNNETYTTIITTYQQAIEYYNQAGNTANSLKAQQAMSSAVGWQLYSMVIPVNMCDLSTMAGNASVLGDILPSSCQVDSVITASYQANPLWPQFVLNYSEILIPTTLVNGVDLISVAQQYLNKTVTSDDILTNVVAPLKTNIYNQLVNLVGQSEVQFTNCTGTVNACIGQLVAQDMAQAQALLSGAVKTSSGVVLQSSYSVIQKNDPVSGVAGYYLIGNNVPLPAMPRFSGEITTAMFYYGQGALPLFSPGTQPVNISGQLLLPAPDATAVTTVNAALFNANYLTLLSLQAQLNSALASPTYTQLKACSSNDLLAMTQNASQLTLYQNFYTNSLATVLTNLLATYDYVADFSSSLTNYPELENFIRAQEVNAYINWISIQKQFLFGDPTALLDHTYKDCLDGIMVLQNQALQLFLNGVSPDQAMALNNQLMNEVCTILENTGDLLSTLPGNIPSIAYPTATSSYPVIPAGATFNKWYDAASFYFDALNFYQNNYQTGYDAGGNPTYSIPTSVGLRLYSKQCLAFYNDAIFRLAVFCNNAFTECKCKLYTGSYTPPGGTQVSLTNSFESVAIAQQVEIATPVTWNQNLDMTINTLITPNIQGNYVCDQTGAGVSLTPQVDISQGVITQLTPAFKEFLLAANGGCSTNIYNDGPGCGTNAQDAALLMRNQYMVQALSSLSLLSGVSSPNAPVPMQAISNIMALSNKNTETPSAINQYLCGTYTQDSTTNALTVTSSGIFNSNPGFATDAQITAAEAKTNPVPLLYPAISIINVDDKGNWSTQPVVVGAAYTESVLASTNIFYTSTIEYWSSLPRFLQDLQKPVSLWLGNPYDPHFTPIDPATFNSWVGSLNAVAMNIYGNIYYPFATESNLYQSAYNDMQNLSQSNNSQANQYVG